MVTPPDGEGGVGMGGTKGGDWERAPAIHGEWENEENERGED